MHNLIVSFRHIQVFYKEDNRRCLFKQLLTANPISALSESQLLLENGTVILRKELRRGGYDSVYEADISIKIKGQGEKQKRDIIVKLPNNKSKSIDEKEAPI